MPIYSPGRLDSFRTCPLQYKFHYIDKVEVEEVQSIEAFMGSLVHDALEKLYKDLKLSKLNSLDDVLKYYRDLWEKSWTDDIKIMKKGFTQENYLKTGERCITDYFRRYQPFQERTLGLELKISAPLDKEEDIKISGYIDRLVEPEDGSFEIHDYKTGAWLPKPEGLKDDRQLSLYQLAVENTWPKAKEVKLVWHYLAYDKELSITRSRKEVEEIRKETIDLIKRIEKTTDFRPNQSGLCGWCDYSAICPAMGHEMKVESLPPNKYLKDDGVKLVNKLTELKARKAELNSEVRPELEKTEKEIEQVQEAILAYCKREKLTRLVGSSHQVEIKPGVSFEMPGKNDEGREELEEIIKKTGKWDEVSTLDKGLLLDALTEGEWDKGLKKKIEKYTQITEDVKISHTKRKDLDMD